MAIRCAHWPPLHLRLFHLLPGCVTTGPELGIQKGRSGARHSKWRRRVLTSWDKDDEGTPAGPPGGGVRVGWAGGWG